jgi:hypothetical protein
MNEREKQKWYELEERKVDYIQDIMNSLRILIEIKRNVIEEYKKQQ